jgi:hypothetical protein
MTESGGTSPFTWAITSGTLPSGLSFSSSGVFSGTPTTTGTTSLTIQITDAASLTASASYSLVIGSSGTVTITTSSLASGVNGRAYSQTLAATGGTSPYTWAVTSGTLPTGISLSSGGVFSGTPSVSTTASLTIQATDSASNTATHSYSLVINPALSITTSSLPAGTNGTAYSATMGATGGTSPYTWAITSGTLPTGMSFSSSGVFSGTPSVTTTVSLTIQATDAASYTASTTLSLVINAASGNLILYSGTVGAIYNTTIWPPGNDYSSGVTYNNTTNLQSGHSYNLAITGSYQYIQQATNWPTIQDGGTNGYNLSPYTKLQFDCYPTGGVALNGGVFHYQRTAGNDIAVSTNVQSGAMVTITGLTLTQNAWNYGVTLPLVYFGGLSQYNYYKLLVQITTGGTMLMDNVQFVPGNVGWIYRGNSSLESGWVESSTNLTTNYSALVNNLLSGGTSTSPNNSGTFALNASPSPATNFTGSISGTTLTVSAVASGTIAIGQTVLCDSITSPSTCRIVSGSGSTWTLSSSQTAASQTMTSCVQPYDVCSMQLNTTAVNAIWRANYSAGFSISPYTNFAFGAIATKSGYGYQVQFYNTSGTAIGSAVTMTTPSDQGVYSGTTGSWAVYNATLSSFGLGVSTIGGVSIKDMSSNTTNTIYISALGFWS